MACDLEAKFELLTPLVDDVMQHIGRLAANQTEQVVLANLAQSQIGLSTALAFLHSDLVDDPLSEEQRSEIMDLLSRKVHESDEMLKLAIEKFVFGATLQ